MNANILDLIGSFSSEKVAVTKQPLSEKQKDSVKKDEEAPGVRRRDRKHTPLAAVSPRFCVLIFSKDRPFQLQSLLLSIEEFFLDTPCHIFVIYTTSSPLWMQLYDAVFAMFSLTVTPILETTFSQDVENCVNQISEKVNNGIVMLCVDDLIFYDNISFREIAHCLDALPTLYGVHLKLHPGICYSHPGSCASPPPVLTPVGNMATSATACTTAIIANDDADVHLAKGAKSDSPDLVTGLLGFNFRSASADWAYPFDLCGAVYRISDLHHIVSVIRTGEGAQDGYKNPNVFEVSGNKVLWGAEGAQFTMGACLTRPVCSVVTVNIVQDTYDVPIYDTTGGDLATLNAYIKPLAASGDGERNVDSSRHAAMIFDYARYKNSNYISVHVKDLYLRPLVSPLVSAVDSVSVGSGLTARTDTKVSVLLPIFNGAQFISRCLQSILRQTYSHYEVICILNGCTDSSEEICSSFVEQFSTKGVMMRILVLEEASLVGALRTGLEAATRGAVQKGDHSRGSLICRMDIDDIMLSPNRFSSQVLFLETNPDIHVLGTQSILCDEPSVTSDGRASSSLAAGIPTHPVLVQWEMLFRCVVLHPTVMFRADVIASCGSYDNHLNLATCCAEDYMLWTQVIQKFPFSISNLARVDMCLCRHAQSKSLLERDLTQVENMHIRWSLAEPLLKNTVGSENGGGLSSLLGSTEDDVFAIFMKIFHPEDIVSASEIKGACHLLHNLFTSYLSSLPPSERLDDALISLLTESKIKAAAKFLSKCAFRFSADSFADEMTLLDVSPTLLLKYQLSGRTAD